jgi:hypothetical protein
MDVTQLAFSVEDLLRPFPGEAERFGEGAEEFDDLGDVVVIFAIFGAGLGVEEVVTCDEFEGLFLLVSDTYVNVLGWSRVNEGWGFLP